MENSRSHRLPKETDLLRFLPGRSSCTWSGCTDGPWGGGCVQGCTDGPWAFSDLNARGFGARIGPGSEEGCFDKVSMSVALLHSDSPHGTLLRTKSVHPVSAKHHKIELEATQLHSSCRGLHNVWGRALTPSTIQPRMDSSGLPVRCLLSISLAPLLA